MLSYLTAVVNSLKFCFCVWDAVKLPCSKSVVGWPYLVSFEVRFDIIFNFRVCWAVIAWDFILSSPFLFFSCRFWRSVLAFCDKVICFILELVLFYKLNV